jgi:hypothetical protein
MSRKCRRVAAVVACSRSVGNAVVLVCASQVSAKSENKPYYSSAPWTVYQHEGPVALDVGRQAVYNSLLIPLAADEEAAAVGDSIQVIADSPETTTLRVTRDDKVWTLTMDADGPVMRCERRAKGDR